MVKMKPEEKRDGECGRIEEEEKNKNGERIKEI